MARAGIKRRKSERPGGKMCIRDRLLLEHGPTRDDVVAWAKNEVKIETEKYKKEKEAQTVLIPFLSLIHI